MICRTIAYKMAPYDNGCREALLRRVLAFGAGRVFFEQYAEYLKRYGFSLVPFGGKEAAAPGGGRPVFLVCYGLLSARQSEKLASVLASDKETPIVLIDDGRGKVPKDLADRAGSVISAGSPKNALLRALKDCSTLLGLRERQEHLERELMLKSAELSYMQDVAKTLASSDELPKVLKKIMERMRVLVSAEAWAVMLVGGPDRELMVEAEGGASVRHGRKLSVVVGEGAAGLAAERMEPVLVRDAAKEPGMNGPLEKRLARPARSVMCVPITSNKKLLGVAELVNKKGDGFDAGDVALVARLMDHTAIAIERAALYQRMADLVITDDLTKLFNLRYLDRTLEVEIERAARYSHSVALIFMDIDFFKKVNDKHGHLAGSKVLVEVSQLLLQGLRRVDIVARYGGDEFVIVLPQTDQEAARSIAGRLRRSIEKHAFLRHENVSLRITASFGIACYPAHAANREELLRLADEAMYRVKFKTRNGVFVVGEGG